MSKCKCMMCDEGKTLGDLVEWEIEMMDRFGWYTHFVGGQPAGDEFVNAHTHGLDHTWKHPDFQIVIMLDERNMKAILDTLVDRVKAGEKFTAGMEVEHVIKNMPVRLVEATEAKRKVLRVVFPDKNGRWPGEPGVDPVMGRQVEIEV